MSVVDLESLSNDNLKKLVASLVSLEDWSNSCRACGIPSLLHKDGPCTRQEQEPPDVVMQVRTEFKRREAILNHSEGRLQEGGRTECPLQ